MVKVEILKQCGYNFLWIDGKLWMWDVPQEVKAQASLAKQCFGDVLVVGYGLGVIHRFLRKMPEVSTITSIEKYREVLEVVCRTNGGEVIGKVLIDDFYEAILSPDFDCIVGDIWIDICPEMLVDYKRFKERALMWLKPGGKVLGWGSDYYEYLIGLEGSKEC